MNIDVFDSMKKEKRREKMRIKKRVGSKTKGNEMELYLRMWWLCF